MNDFSEFAHLFRKPSDPVIVDIDGVLVAGETWTFVVMESRAVLSPLSFDNPTKLQLVRWYNNRANKSADDVDYSEKSLSSKRRDRIVPEIANRLLAET